jgi:hypothetical protein
MSGNGGRTNLSLQRWEQAAVAATASAQDVGLPTVSDIEGQLRHGGVCDTARGLTEQDLRRCASLVRADPGASTSARRIRTAVSLCWLFAAPRCFHVDNGLWRLTPDAVIRTRVLRAALLTHLTPAELVVCQIIAHEALADLERNLFPDA